MKDADWSAAQVALEAQLQKALSIPPALVAVRTHDIDVIDLGGLFIAKCTCGEREMGSRVSVLTWSSSHRYRKVREAPGAVGDP